MSEKIKCRRCGEEDIGYRINDIPTCGKCGVSLEAAVKTRNSEVLEDFVKYCTAHPSLRFWQALLSWSKAPFIVTSSHPPACIFAETRVMGQPSERVELEDTYYWEGQNG